MSKKTNPRKIPATQADVKRAKEQGYAEGVEAALVMVLYAIADKEHFPKWQIQRIGKEVNDVSDSVIKGYVTIPDILHMLKEEYDIEV